MNIKVQTRKTEPLSALFASHRQIEATLDLLRIVITETPVEGLPPPYHSNLECITQLLPTILNQHFQDEVDFLFPILSPDPLAELIIERLENDHTNALRLQRCIVDLGKTWLGDGMLSNAQRRLLNDSSQELIQIMKEHIKAEQQMLFPLAHGRLGLQVLERLNQKITARRLTV